MDAPELQVTLQGPYDENHVAIVEDHDDTRFAFGALLEASGYRVTAAASGRQGLAAVGVVRPLCVVVDLGLPDIDDADSPGNCDSDTGQACSSLR